MQSVPKKLSNRLNLTQDIHSQRTSPIKQTSLNSRKTTRAYTQIIFEDDMLFHNIKVKGLTLQNPQIQKKDDQVKRSKTSKSQRKSSLRKNILSIKQERKTATNWTERASRIYKKQQTGGILNKHARSITVESVELQKGINDSKSDAKVLKTEPNQKQKQTKYPSITYKQQNLNEQIYCNFKEILDEFNKVKKMIKEKGQQSNKPPKAAERHFRQTYKKPNIYQYQEFYRQNYQYNQVKDTIFLFKKHEVSERNPEEYRSPRKQGPFIGKKVSNNFLIDTCYQSQYNQRGPSKDSKIVVHMGSPSSSNQNNSEMNSKKAPCNYLQITSRIYSMSQKFNVQHKKTKRPGFNRSEVVCCQDFNAQENQSQRIEPWTSFINPEDAT